MSIMSFDEVHVVSDLHLGGPPGFQIFSQGDTLAATIRRLAAKPAGRRVGLVLNGDIVDFLAEPNAKYLDPEGAIDKLRRIFAEDSGQASQDTSFAPVWSALKAFVAKRNRQLILVLGNHDVELALPPVMEWVIETLSDGKEAARGRITGCVDGAGFACEVGGKRVLCVHGNEVDAWNRVDYRQLLEVARAMNRGLPPEPWDANAGTRMVIDIMNDIKRRFPMVDLLKPEVEAAVPIVLALDPSRLKEVTKLLKVVGFLKRDQLLHRIGLLSAEEALEQAPAEVPSDEEVVDAFLSAHFADAKGAETKGASGGGSLLDDALDSLDSGESGSGAEEEEFLGPFDYFKALFGSSEKRAERLREALKDKLEGDKTFDVAYEDEPYRSLAEEVGDEVDYLIAGHTHLERAIERRTPGRWYYNSGTWIRLIRLSEEVLDSPEQFARVYDAFMAQDIAALDAVQDLGPGRDRPLVLQRPTVVSVVSSEAGVFGELRHAQPDGSLKSVPDTRFP
jgi:UDP-2,3-diacylglucosamine pyrophosphatase LpxH